MQFITEHAALRAEIAQANSTLQKDAPAALAKALDDADQHLSPVDAYRVVSAAIYPLVYASVHDETDPPPEELMVLCAQVSNMQFVNGFNKQDLSDQYYWQVSQVCRRVLGDIEAVEFPENLDPIPRV